MIKFFILAALCAVALAAPQYGGHSQEQGYEQEESAPPKYSYEYSVSDPHTGDYHSAREERDGDNTQGEYSLVEPDGSRRNVQYHVEGKSGFLAEVHREAGKGGYEQPAYRPHPSYQQPAYRPQPSYQQPAYRPQASYQQPAYRPQPSYQQPAYQRPAYSSYHH